MRSALALLLLLPSATSSGALPVEEIDLDLPPSERWVAFAQKHRSGIIAHGMHFCKMFEVALGKDIAARWVKAAPLDADLRAEYESIVRVVNHSDVTLARLVLGDMWQAVNSPIFGCSGVLMAMPNGTVLHGRNIDYDGIEVIRQATATGAGMGGTSMYDGVFKKGGKAVAEFLASVGSLGIHTGMRVGAYTVNSNARLFNNSMLDNLRAHEAGGRNFPWEIRKLLETVPDFHSAVSYIENVKLNAPNYFIFAGTGPYEGAVVTKDRLGNREPSTPPTQRLDQAKGVWHLVQTNDDLLSPPADARRGAALLRLSKSRQSQVSMDFVQHEMQSLPVMNSDTLLTWVANPRTGEHRVLERSAEELGMGMASKVIHKALGIPMPQELPRKPAAAERALLRGSLETE